jgi:uncharacterized protein YebE (UPF0316 family)
MSLLELMAGPAGPAVIFLLRVIDVSMGTLRIAYVTRRAKLPAAVLGFFELLVWITAAGSTILNFTSPLHVIAYAGGFATGTWIGIWLEARAPFGMATVQAYSRELDTGISAALREMGMGVTEIEGEGLEGPVDVVSTVVPRRIVPRVIQAIEERDPDAFITVYEAQVRRGRFPGAVRK